MGKTLNIGCCRKEKPTLLIYLVFYFVSLLGIHANFVSEEHEHFKNQKVWLLFEAQTGVF